MTMTILAAVSAALALLFAWLLYRSLYQRDSLLKLVLLLYLRDGRAVAIAALLAKFDSLGLRATDQDLVAVLFRGKNVFFVGDGTHGPVARVLEPAKVDAFLKLPELA